MKQIGIILAILCFSTLTYGQYTTSGGEILFSFAELGPNMGDGGKLRFVPAINYQTNVHFDLGSNLGVFSGWAIRNTGFIYDVPDNLKDNNNPSGAHIQKRFRTYNLGIPLALKIGDMDGGFIYGGCEIEFPFAYKEKTYIDDNKSKFTDWWSNDIVSIHKSLFVGIESESGVSLKFKYYVTNFFKDNGKQVSGMTNNFTYGDFKANMFYVSLNYSL